MCEAGAMDTKLNIVQNTKMPWIPMDAYHGCHGYHEVPTYSSSLKALFKNAFKLCSNLFFPVCSFRASSCFSCEVGIIWGGEGT